MGLSRWPFDFKWILAEFLHDTTHPLMVRTKYLTILNQHWWENFKNTAEIILGPCAACERYNPGKTVKVRHGQNTFRWILSSSRSPWDLFIFRMGYSISLLKIFAEHSLQSLKCCLILCFKLGVYQLLCQLTKAHNFMNHYEKT